MHLQAANNQALLLMRRLSLWLSSPRTSTNRCRDTLWRTMQLTFSVMHLANWILWPTEVLFLLTRLERCLLISKSHWMMQAWTTYCSHCPWTNSISPIPTSFLLNWPLENKKPPIHTINLEWDQLLSFLNRQSQWLNLWWVSDSSMILYLIWLYCCSWCIKSLKAVIF